MHFFSKVKINPIKNMEAENYGMTNKGYGHGYGGWGWIVLIIFVIIVICAIAWAVSRDKDDKCHKKRKKCHKNKHSRRSTDSYDDDSSE